MAPAPKARVHKGHFVENPEPPQIPEVQLIDFGDDPHNTTEFTPKRGVANGGRCDSPTIFETSPKATFMRRSSSGVDGSIISIRGNVNDMREHLKHLGPSNLASRPKSTRYNAVKIKPGHVANNTDSRRSSTINRDSITEERYEGFLAAQGGEGEGLLRSAGKDASDGVQALQYGYGSLDRSVPDSSSKLSKVEQSSTDGATKNRSRSPKGHDKLSASPRRRTASGRNSDRSSDRSSDTLGSMNSSNSPTRRMKGVARSGSITENIIEAGGVRKVVLETNSSKEDISTSSSSKRGTPKASLTVDGNPDSEDEHTDRPASAQGEEVKKKRRRQRKKKGVKSGGESSAT